MMIDDDVGVYALLPRNQAVRDGRRGVEKEEEGEEEEGQAEEHQEQEEEEFPALVAAAWGESEIREREIRERKDQKKRLFDDFGSNSNSSSNRNNGSGSNNNNYPPFNSNQSNSISTSSNSRGWAANASFSQGSRPGFASNDFPSLGGADRGWGREEEEWEEEKEEESEEERGKGRKGAANAPSSSIGNHATFRHPKDYIDRGRSSDDGSDDNSNNYYNDSRNDGTNRPYDNDRPSNHHQKREEDKRVVGVVKRVVACPCNRKKESFACWPGREHELPQIKCDNECETIKRRGHLAAVFGIANPDSYVSVFNRPGYGGGGGGGGGGGEKEGEGSGYASNKGVGTINGSYSAASSSSTYSSSSMYPQQQSQQGPVAASLLAAYSSFKVATGPYSPLLIKTAKLFADHVPSIEKEMALLVMNDPSFNLSSVLNGNAFYPSSLGKSHHCAWTSHSSSSSLSTQKLLPAMPKSLRILVHELSAYYGLQSFSEEHDSLRSVRLQRTPLAVLPPRPLSESALIMPGSSSSSPSPSSAYPSAPSSSSSPFFISLASSLLPPSSSSSSTSFSSHLSTPPGFPFPSTSQSSSSSTPQSSSSATPPTLPPVLLTPFTLRLVDVAPTTNLKHYLKRWAGEYDLIEDLSYQQASQVEGRDAGGGGGGGGLTAKFLVFTKEMLFRDCAATLASGIRGVFKVEKVQRKG